MTASSSRNISAHTSQLDRYRAYLEVHDAIHAYLRQKKYLRLELPVLSPTLIPESYLEIFETTFQYFDTQEKLYLTPSPELFIKRLLAEGIGDCYYLGKSFRNSEPSSSRHESEFTMLEWYKVGKSYMYMADEVLGLFQKLAQVSHNSHVFTYQGIGIDVSKLERMTVAESFERYANIKEGDLFDHPRFLNRAKEKKYFIEGFTFEDIFSQMYTQEIEPHLGMNGNPTLLYDYPVEFAALSKPNDDGRTAQRFECYICGLELGNCYSELTDWKLQKDRLQKEEDERKKSGKIGHPTDWGFIEALKKGLPESTGIAIGVERLGMIFADAASIQDLQLITIS